MKKVEKLFFLFTALFGVFLAIEGWNFKLFRDSIPGPGFFPFFIGLVMTLVSAGFLGSSLLRGKSDVLDYVKRDSLSFATIIGGGIAAGLMSSWLGLLPSLALVAAVVAKILGTKKWKTAIIFAIILTAVLYVIFDLFLAVPLPKGIFKR